MARVSSSLGRHLVGALVGLIAGTASFQAMPFPHGDPLAQLVAFDSPRTYRAVTSLDTAMRFTTPYLLVLSLTSMAYVFFSRRSRAIVPGKLPPYPVANRRRELFLILGELHHPTRVEPSANPSWLVIPEKGLYTGIAIIGAVGTGKTSGLMYPIVDQLFGYWANEPKGRIGGLCLEVKGDFHRQVKRVLQKYGREDDYIEVGLRGEYRYNPLYGDVDAYALAFGVSQLMVQLYGRSHEPFWVQAETNLLKFLILLYQTVDDYVTLLDVYQAAIDPPRIAAKLDAGERKWFAGMRATIQAQDYVATSALEGTVWETDPTTGRLTAPWTLDLQERLISHGIRHDWLPPPDEKGQQGYSRRAQLEAIRRWYQYDWLRIEPKLRTSIVEGVSVFLSIFDDVDVKHTFCPPRELYDPIANADGLYGKALPPFPDLIAQGRVCVLNMPLHVNPMLAKAVAIWLKHQFQRAMLLRIPSMNDDQPYGRWRPAAFIADEAQMVLTTGEHDPSGDEHFFALQRQAKCITVLATQSISSLRSTLPGETWRTLLQTLRTTVFLGLSDDFSTRYASDRCGRTEQLRPQYSIGESGQDARVSLLTGRPTAGRSTMSASKSYQTQLLPMFEPKVFAELATAQAIVLASDGARQAPPTLCYLKPAHLDANVDYFEQVARGQLT